MKDKNSNVLKVLKGLEKNTANPDIKNACEKSLWTLNQEITDTPNKDTGIRSDDVLNTPNARSKIKTISIYF